jgi:hypothetical protein
MSHKIKKNNSKNGIYLPTCHLMLVQRGVMICNTYHKDKRRALLSLGEEGEHCFNHKLNILIRHFVEEG